jgi:hypothetical protein
MQSKNYIASENINKIFFLTNHSRFSQVLFTAVFLLCGLLTVSEIRAATITVDRTDDTAAASACTAAANDCSLRGAFAFANANSGTVISVLAGTYNLTIDELQVGTATNILTTINGAGSNLVTINQTVVNRRVIDLNPSLAANVVVNISGVRITGGNSPSDNFGGGGLIGGGAGNTLNLTNCIFENNSDINALTAKGGGVEWAGGGFLNIDNCTFNNNTAGSAAANKGVGGGVDYQLLNLAGSAGQGGLTVTDSTFTGNKAGASNAGAGGGLALAVTTVQTPRTVTITNNVFTGNQANAASNGRGGAITSSSANPITVKFNRIVGNTATGLATGVYQSTGSSGTFDATENWWGCNAGPGNTGCDSVSGPGGSITTNPRIVLSHTPTTSPIIIGQATGLTASFLRDSANNVLTLANISRLIGLPITFNGAVRGTLSGAQTTIQANGTATATFTSNAAGAGSANAVVDSQTTTAAITINKGNTTITMNSSTPNSTVTGQAYTVSFNPPTAVAPAVGTLTGTVTVSEGTASCTATLPATSCSLTSASIGTKNLTATYNGDANFNASPASTSIPHTVNKANTAAAVTADTPDPSVFGQTYAVSANVTVNSPGSGTPTGSVTVSDGANNCTITLPATSCNLPSDAVGAKTLTAVYNGDANFNASPASTGVSHTINQANTTVVITSAVANPPGSQNVIVTFSVTANAPGAGTPSGNVTVTDGVDSCFGTVAAGQCTLILSTFGARTLTATYAGDMNFTGSVSVGFPYQGCAMSMVVTNTTDSGAGSLRQAVVGVCSGGTIAFDASFNAPKTITLTSGEITIDRSLTLNGPGANLLTVSGNNASRVFFINNAPMVNLSGFKVTGGNGVSSNLTGVGGGLLITNSTVNLNKMWFTGNSAQLGGGLSATLSTITISNSSFDSNTADQAGGLDISDSTATIINTTVSGNASPNLGAVTLTGTTGATTMTMINSTVVSNNGVGIYIYNAGSAPTVQMQNNLVAGNTNNNFLLRDNPVLISQGFNLDSDGSSGLTNGVGGDQVGTAIAPINPMLGALGLNGGTTPTHALLPGSPAIDKGGAVTVPFAENVLPPLTTDQRGAMRPVDIASIPNAVGGDGSDIGAFELQAPTAANVSVSGRVLTPTGGGISNAVVTMTDSGGNIRTAKTNSFGYFRFETVEIGQTYIFQVVSKRFTFAPQIVTLDDEITELNFISQNY